MRIRVVAAAAAVDVVVGGSMGLWTFLEGQMLVANAFAILNEDRFLAPKGLTLANLSGGRRNSLKGQLVGLISG
ncbi:hypothetical protein MLD38_027124 [Melastoma candidum]|uniref:Uncharacterized protein n=1 Tax=Melastoma candidum TaxID=119954 RepID=A0ACB9P2C4_9MYRT|nr:hypothetical protein MLD38_027124 [Melastoma candidum]